MSKISLFGLGLLLLGFVLAFFAHSTIWYSPFVVGGFLFLEGINAPRGFSILKNKRRFFRVWLTFLSLGVVVEIFFNAWLNLFDYPSFNSLDYLIHVVIIGYPFVGLFGLEAFVLLQDVFPSKKVQVFVLPISAFLFGYLNEYPNLFAYEWVYINWPLGEFLRIPILISILWIGLLSSLFWKKLFVFTLSRYWYTVRRFFGRVMQALR